jgi:hypothetical protein
LEELSFLANNRTAISIKMISAHRSSDKTIWKSDKEFGPGSEHDKNGLMKGVEHDWNTTGGIPALQYSPSHWLQVQSDYKKLRQAGCVFLSLVVLHCVYLGAFSRCKFKNSSSQHQVPILHFSTPASTLNSPNGLFVDSNNTWHIYFQCQL